MARVAAFIPDLLFGSNVVGALTVAGHEVQLVSELPKTVDADVLIVDLTTDAETRIANTVTLGRERPAVLAFYSHVENEVKEAAQSAGLDLVVPRSRMAREGAALVERLSRRQ